jgi:homoserine O-acetyltransferase
MEREMKKLKNGRLFLIPQSSETRGHGTTGMARFWKQEFAAFLAWAPKQGM